MSVIEQVATLTAPWAHIYNGSKLLSTGVVFIHLGGLLLGGGFAIAADRTTLRMLRANTAIKRIHLSELHSIHRPVLIGLTLTLLSGLLMLGADVETFLPAPLFWIKMALIAVLLGNGVALQRAETQLRRGAGRADLAWKRLARSARASLALWFGALLLGTALLAA
jgi:hypothetical protein